MDAAAPRPHCPPVNIAMPVWNCPQEQGRGDVLAACLDVYNDAGLDEAGKVAMMARLLRGAKP